MKEARSAGWTCLVGGLVFIPFAIVFRWQASLFSAWPLIRWQIMAFSWINVALVIIFLLYAVWGLVCGYSQKAWDAYARQIEEDIRKGAMEACIGNGMEPPQWMN